jgi:hypothetical protein
MVRTDPPPSSHLAGILGLLNPFPCGIGPFGPGLLRFNTTQRVNFKNLKKLCNPWKLSQLHIYLQMFHQKMLIYICNTWFSRPNPKILGHLAQCRIVSNLQEVWEKFVEKKIRLRHFIKQLLASQTSENIFYKTKVVSFEKIIL